MYIDLVKAVVLCHLEQSVDMCNVAVNAAVGDKTHHMESCPVLFCVVDGLKEIFIFKEISILDRLGNSRKLLINDAACAHIHVADLRIAHLAIRKTYSKTRCISLLERAFRLQLIHNRSVGKVYRVMLMHIALAIAVKNHHNCWSLIIHSCSPFSYVFCLFTYSYMRILSAHLYASYSFIFYFTGPLK